jgi:hypothetical protein
MTASRLGRWFRRRRIRITDAARVRLEPGDAVILSVPVEITTDDAGVIRGYVEQVFPGHPVIILAGGVRLEVARDVGGGGYARGQLTAGAAPEATIEWPAVVGVSGTPGTPGVDFCACVFIPRSDCCYCGYERRRHEEAWENEGGA